MKITLPCHPFFLSCLLLCLLAFSSALNTQQKLNLDFEEPSIEGLTRPWCWALDGWGPNNFTMDSTEVFHGQYSLHANVDTKPEESLPALQTNLEPYFLRDKEISIEGFVKTQLLDGQTWISVGYAYLDQQKEWQDTSFVIFHTSAVKDWTKFSYPLHFPNATQSIFIKIHLAGKGKIWYDAFDLKVAGEVLNTLPVAPAFKIEQEDWIRKQATSFPCLRVGDCDTDDFSFFKDAVGDGPLVAMGECTHGTSEFFELKHQTLAYAVEHLGFRVFALEDNQVVCERINRYTLGHDDKSLQEAMYGVFNVWHTQEVAALIEWVRSYNQAHADDPVFFVGFDMQELPRPLQRLFDFLENRDPVLAQKSHEHLADLVENKSPGYALTDSVKQAWLHQTEEVYHSVKMAAGEWYDQAKTSQDSIAILEAIQYANLIRQYATQMDKGPWALYRDEAMAENIIWLAEQRFPDKKILIWAHDTHISKSSYPETDHNLNNSIAMGRFLADHFGEEYKAFGLLTYEGSYTAQISYANLKRVAAPLYPAPEGSLEEALHRVAIERGGTHLFLPTPRTEASLTKPLPHRFANHVNIEYGFWLRISIPYQFDAVFFIDQTKGSQGLTD